MALFARYDVQQRGFVDYYEFIHHVMGKDYLSDKATKALGVQVQALLRLLRRGDPFPASPRSEQLAKGVDVHALSDDAFMHRQKVRRVFGQLDKDGSGFLDESEFRRLLAIIGVHASHDERLKIFTFVAELSTATAELEEKPQRLLEGGRQRRQAAPSRWGRPAAADAPRITFEAFYKWFVMDVESGDVSGAGGAAATDGRQEDMLRETAGPNFSTVTFRDDE